MLISSLAASTMFVRCERQFYFPRLVPSHIVHVTSLLCLKYKVVIELDSVR
jgi:hypothetical protein